MRVQTFMGKLGVEALRQMDEHINAWLEERQVTPRIVTQCFGHERPQGSHDVEPVVITSIWY